MDTAFLALQTIALVLALDWPAPQTAGQVSTFTGTWSLDPSQSVLVEGGSSDIDLIVEQTATEVAVTQRTPRSEERYRCSFDGTPSEQRGPSSVYVRTLRRDKDALVWQVKMTRVADQASISFSERWSLSSDRATLTVLRTYPGQRQVLKVFVRKK